MADAPSPLEYASPERQRSTVRRRSLARVVLACFLFPLPVVLILLFLIRLDHSPSSPVPPGAIFASADIRRGNTIGDYGVTAYGFMRDGRPVFDRVSVEFPKPGGPSLEIKAANLTFLPFAKRMNSADYRPVTRAAMLAQFTSRGCDPASPATAELADALYADLQNISAGIPPLPPAHFWTGPYAPPPEDSLLSSSGVLVGWLVVSCIAAFIAVRTRSRRMN
jgi:hypothetical protein